MPKIDEHDIESALEVAAGSFRREETSAYALVMQILANEVERLRTENKALRTTVDAFGISDKRYNWLRDHITTKDIELFSQVRKAMWPSDDDEFKLMKIDAAIDIKLNDGIG